jgi:hypothetical protein
MPTCRTTLVIGVGSVKLKLVPRGPCVCCDAGPKFSAMLPARRRLLLLAAGLALGLVACRRPPLDAERPLLATPAQLPPFAVERASPGPAGLAAQLTETGAAQLLAGEVTAAVPTLTQALTTDPANLEARLLLARSFARGGRSSVALRLLAPAKACLRTSGVCVWLLQAMRDQADFAHLRETAEGRALLAEVPTTPLPFAGWAKAAAKALQTTDLAGLVRFVDERQTFDLVRSCPTCQNIGARAETVRKLQGMAHAAKVAVRFDTVHPEARGIPLEVVGEPACAERCCTWSLPSPQVTEGKAALQRLCFWPTTPAQGVLTEVRLVYGASSH